MKRRIVKQGSATMTISLPATWIKRFGLKEGDELELNEVEDMIEISTEPKGEIKKTEIDVSALSKKTTQRVLSALYRIGYDEVKLKFAGQISAIQETIDQQLIGFEIITQGKDTCVIKDLGGTKEEEFDNALRRCFLLLKSLADESLEAIKKNDRDALKSITYMDININKFSNFCERALIKKGHSHYSRTAFYYHFVEELEGLGDEYKYLCEDYLEGRKKISKNEIEFFEKTNNLAKEYIDLFYKFNISKVDEVLQGISELKKSAKVDSEIMHHLLDIIDLMSSSLGSYFSINF